MEEIAKKGELTQKLRSLFESWIYSRGVNYFKSGRVKKIKAFSGSGYGEIEIKAKVAGGRNYNVSLVFDLEKSRFSSLNCDCPYGACCKHMAALGVAFIDVYAEFLEEIGDDYDFGDIGDFRNRLVYWINGEEAPKKNSEQDQNSLEKLLESVGIDSKKISKDILDVLKKNMKKEPKRLFSAGELSKNQKEEKIKPKEEKFDPNKYYVSLYLDSYYSTLDVYNSNNSKTTPQTVLKKKDVMTDSQKTLFEELQRSNSWSYRGDIAKTLALIKDSQVPLYSGYGYSKKRIEFADNPEKIKAALGYKDNEGAGYEIPKHEFIFKLGKRYEDKSGSGGSKMICGSGCIAYLKNNSASIYNLPDYLVKIIKRITECPGYVYGDKADFLAVKLLDSEIVNLNRIIKDGKEFLDFKTDLTPDYNIKKFANPRKCIAVDYSQAEETLNIKPAIDYGFMNQDVSEAVYCARHGGKRSFKRKENYYNNYIFDILGKDIFYAPLDKKKEMELFKDLYGREELGFSKTLKCRRAGMGQIFDFFAKNWKNIQEFASKNKLDIKFLRDEFNFAEENFRADFNVDLDASIDWLGFDVDCYCGKNQVSLEDLKDFIENKREFIKTKDGKLARISNREELERFVMMLESFYAKENGKFEGKLYHAPELEDIFTKSEYYSAKVEKGFSDFIKEAQSGKPVEKIKLSKNRKEVLRDYQEDGISWFYFLRKYRFAGILADEMGLGKTLQALTVLDMEKSDKKTSLVVCPKTLMYNWQNEAEKFFPQMKTIVLDGLAAERAEKIKKLKNYDLAITGYALVKRDLEIYKKNKAKFNYCILDEAQFVKNHATQNARVIKQIDADYRLALTGTPLENSVSEVWSIFDFLMPGFLGSYNSFCKKFQNPIMKQNSAAAMGALQKKIKCFMLRRTKKEVLKELPPKIEQVSSCQLGKAQNILYQEILANVKKEIFESVEKKGFNNARIHILAGLTKLRQVCNHPVLLLKDKNYAKYESAKLDLFRELIEEIIESDKKVLVFSQFTTMLDILEKECNKGKINYSYLSGKTKNRQKIVDEFNTDKSKKIFLISLKAGGTGLNLTSADSVIIFDPWWNPSVENQAIDRAHRIGQKNSVNVYRLITEGTIEEKIVKLQEKKKRLFDSLVGESKDLFQKLTWDDVKELFR